MPFQKIFAEVLNNVSKIHDIIISDMQYGLEKENASKQEALSFSKHLMATKHWFSRISSCNKKRYVSILLGDIESAWTLSLILKSIWNCRPKDAVCSVSQANIIWSGYDVTPMDHNRTAAPVEMLVQVMQTDRGWFQTLRPESQAVVLMELLSVAGGPVMWAVLSRAQAIYKKYREDQLANIQECLAGKELTPMKRRSLEQQDKSKEKSLNAGQAHEGKSKEQSIHAGQSQEDKSKEHSLHAAPPKKVLERSLAKWDNIIEAMKVNFGLEELEITVDDKSKGNIWKVIRPEPSRVLTVDFVSLPGVSHLARRILSFLPRATLGRYAPVNQYWAYLVNEVKEERNMRVNLNFNILKLKRIVLHQKETISTRTRHPETPVFDATVPSSMGINGISTATSKRMHADRRHSSFKPSEKSAALSLGNLLIEKPAMVTHLPPISNLAVMSDRLNTRGAADINLRRWCQILLKERKKKQRLPSNKATQQTEGVLKLADRFPCPLMKESVNLPLLPPLAQDPSVTSTVTKPKPAITNAMVATTTQKSEDQSKFSLWSRDFSSLYSAMKISSYQNLV